MKGKIKTYNINELLGLPEDWEEQEKVKEGQANIEVNIDDLVPFKNHPFKLYEGPKLDEMVESIKEFGIITPLIVRSLENGKYEILSGHNRVNAGKIAELEKVPVVVKENLTDEEATLIVTETNLIQRSFSELSHSEKARILSERHEIIKDRNKIRMGEEISEEKQKKIDIINEIEMLSTTDGLGDSLHFRPLGETHRSDEMLAEEYTTSPRNISRYLRVNKLNDELLSKLDKGDIPFRAGVELSYLNEENQNTVNDLLDEYNYKVDLKKASEIKRLNKARNLTYNKMNDILSGEYFKKPKEKKPPKLSVGFNKKVLEKFEDREMSIKDIENLVLKLIDEYMDVEVTVEDEWEDGV